MFTTGVSNFLTTFFSNIWELFQLNYPGTNSSIFGIIAGALIGLFLFKIVAGFISGDMFSASPTAPYRGDGKTVNSDYIDSKRKGDSK